MKYVSRICVYKECAYISHYLCGKITVCCIETQHSYDEVACSKLTCTIATKGYTSAAGMMQIGLLLL